MTIEAPSEDFNPFFVYYSKTEYEGIQDELKACAEILG
jgi:hypothetical protein